MENELYLNQESQGDFLELSKWAKFFAILGFIGVAFLLLAALFVGVFLPSMMPMSSGFEGLILGFMSLFYIIFAVIYFFPCWFLYKSSNQTREAIEVQNSFALAEGIKNLKNYFKYVGIMIIALIALYILGILVVSMMGGMAAIR